MPNSLMASLTRTADDLLTRFFPDGDLAPRLRQLRAQLAASFWLRPTSMTVAAVALALSLISVEGLVERESWIAVWVYAGGVAGARDVLGTIAGATIAVAGTTFSITVAALTLASNQMGPRLLRNFRQDPGNQYALGAFLATFAFSLTALRSVHEADEGAFVPQTALAVAMLFAFACVGVLIWFLHHVAASISVDRVIALVHADLAAAIEDAREGETDAAGTLDPPPDAGTATLRAPAKGGYLTIFDDGALADWASQSDAAIRLRVRPGHFLFPRMAVGEVWPADRGEAAQEAFDQACALDETRSGEQDLEYVVRQLVEIGLRALSPGINDPFTAVAVLDHLGATLCSLAGRRLPDGRTSRDGRLRLQRPSTDYAGLLDAMFHAIRQAGAAQAMVAIRLLEMLTEVAGVERDPKRRAELRRHADLACDAALTDASDASVQDAVARCKAALTAALRGAHAPAATVADVAVR